MVLDQSRLGAWRDLAFFSETLPALETHLDELFLPPAPLVFAALERTPPDTANVVILGQDPYPTPGHAHGFAFSTEPTTHPLPRSLANIFKELQSDLGSAPTNGDLRFWADQGVLMLNTTLTVPPGNANGHANLGWHSLTEQVLDRLADRPRAYLLWGQHAQKAAKGVDGSANL